MPEVSNKVIVLFDSGAQAACIKKKLAKRLNLENINYEQVKFAEFDNCRNRYEDYLTNKIRAISINQDNTSEISIQFPLEEEISSWKQSALIVEVDSLSRWRKPKL
uniref:Peptidase aspartic putative domain-containing protein n=1 Tax=Wuchereria bancrofti TaxID=6293 RepID=A0AAF5PYC8_WUCBA